MPPNPYATILRALYGLYCDHRDDLKTLKHIGDIAWALDFELEYDSVYFELAELIMSRLHDPTAEPTHYIDRIEAQLRIFDEHEQGIMNEKRKQYEAERAAFPEIVLMMSFAVHDSAHKKSEKESFSTILSVEGGKVDVKGGTEAMRQLILSAASKVGRRDSDDPRSALERLVLDFPKRVGNLELIWHGLKTRDEVFAPYLH